MKTKKNKIIILAFLLLSASFLLYSQDDNNNKSKQSNEKNLQFGIGLSISTSNLLSLIESAEIYQATKNDTDYNFPGVTEEEQEALKNLDSGMKRAILIANILGGMEYGIQTRVLWNTLMIEADLTLLPFDASYNGRLDLMLTPMIGIRAPFFIMPYALAGVAFTFSFYPDGFAEKEVWRGDWATTDNFVFRPGINIKLGVDLKIKRFSIGAYYEYTVKDFQEYGSWWWHIVNAGYSQAEASGKILAAQSRFGIAACFYIF